MLNGLLRRVTYANVMATIAVFGLLAGGGAYAASKLGPNEIKKNAVRAKHIKDRHVNAKHLAKNAVRTPKIKHGAVTAAKLAEGVEGAAAYGNFDQDGNVQAGALNMDDLTISTSFSHIYCEDQAFKTVVSTGAIEDNGLVMISASAISKAALEQSGSSMSEVGCPQSSEWIYVTVAETGELTPGAFQAVAF